MGICQTYSTSNTYHKDYNDKYRASNPDRIKRYQEKNRLKRREEKILKDMEGRDSHRTTFLLDEYEEGCFI